MTPAPAADTAAKQRTEQHSLFGDILDWMLVPLLLLWPMSVAITWVAATAMANRPFDRDLGETARTLARRVQVQSTAPETQASRVSLALSESGAAVVRGDRPEDTYYQVLGTRGEFVAGDRELPVPQELQSNPGEVYYRDEQVEGKPLRIAYLWVQVALKEDFEIAPLVQVGETLDRRSQLAAEIARGVMLSQFAILPMAVFLVWFAVLRGFRPLDALQRRIRQREVGDLSPIDERAAPEEVAPLVGAINELLSRLDRSVSAQRHFLADAAHQLKTPLAGLRMQAELAQREVDTGDNKAVKRSLANIARASQRSAHMVNQLLAMARAEASQGAQDARKMQPYNLAALAAEAVHDFVPQALAKRQDLGYDGPAPKDERAPRLQGEPVLVREMIRNLVDNAVHYTPDGGTITVRVLVDPFGQVAVLQVDDNGPGIPEAEREQVFQPFYRVLGQEGSAVDGSGLGLAIVREIAERHRGTVGIDAVEARNPHPGTRVTVRLPTIV
jgi:two-component system, OmpR family, sensor histidine kinase TctE